MIYCVVLWMVRRLGLSLVGFLVCTTFVVGQKKDDEQCKVDLCLEEMKFYQEELNHSEWVVNEQRKELLELKEALFNNKYLIQNLTSERDALSVVAAELLVLGQYFIEQEQFENGVMIYNIIIKHYPKSLEAATCKVWLYHYYTDLQTVKKKK